MKACETLGIHFAETRGGRLERNEKMPARIVKKASVQRIPGGKLLLLGGLLMCLGNVVLADDTSTNVDLTNLSIQQLMDIKVSILGSSEEISRTPAAVSVVTQDDIRRSGAMNIPEALRLVPGLDVAQVDASQWAVSARGFNDVFANKLLVLQDGRSIYTPLFSGVFWDVQGTLMDDIDHIEVIRGPGATLWGANAVNGVINIITKKAQDTQGWFVTGGGGTQEQGFGGVRYGGKIGDDAYYRIYGTYSDHDNTVLPDGSDADNAWQLTRGGFRLDWDAANQNSITFQGDGYAGWINQVFGVYDPTSPTYSDMVHDQMDAEGANVLGRWTHTFSDTSNLKVQLYYDHTERDATILNEKRDTFDINLKHEFALGDRNQITWGMGYNVTGDREKNNSTVMFNPDNDTLNVFSVFAQDEISLVKDRLSLTLGSKLEHNDYTGVEVEPGARLLWTPWKSSASRSLASQTFWASISRAVRTPSRAEESIILRQSQNGVPVTIEGTNDFDSEDLIAYEIGYRVQPCRKLSFDVAAFYNDYTDLRSQQLVSYTPPTTVLQNDLFGDTYGGEISATWKVMDGWQLRPSYTILKMNLHAHSDGATPPDENSVAQLEGTSPQNQVSLRSSMDFPHGVTLDTTWRYVDSLPYFHISSYFELDARLGWQLTKNLEVALVGQNLLQDQHAEFLPTEINTQATEIPRSFYAKITWQF